MTERTTHGFFLSTTLHALIVAVVWVTYAFKAAPPPVKIFVLVAGEGDNYLATEAPALGSPSAVKMDLPTPTKVEPVAPAPTKAEPTPIEAAPPVKQTPKEIVPTKAPAPAKKEPTIAKTLERRLKVAQDKGKREAKKEYDAEVKRMTKAQFDAMNKQKDAPAKVAKNTKANIRKIDTVGIKSGVVGGSTANTKGGAGGTALVADRGDEAERYIALLQQRLKEQLDQMPGLEDGLRAEAELTILPDGRVTRGQITDSSGNEIFDVAVLAAIKNVRMPPRPKGVDQVLIVPFSTRARE